MAETTTNRNYALVDAGNLVSADVALIRAAFVGVDLDVAAIFLALGQTALSGHGHAINDITSLTDALAGKAASSHVHTLNSFSDVTASTPGANYLLAWDEPTLKWVAKSAANALGTHGHTIDKITNLQEALDDKALKASPTFTGNPTAPTQALGNNSTRLANTAFVKAAIDNIPAPTIPEGLPVGSSIMYNGATAPTGTLKENGAAVSRTTYADLFAAIGTTHGVGDGSTTFNVPDSRGEFIRGLDDGRGVDSGRVLGVAQSDQNKSHTHTGSTTSTGAHTHNIPTSATNFGGSSIAHGNASGAVWNFNSGSGGSHSHSLTINANGGTEARPRNVAKLMCIKY